MYIIIINTKFTHVIVYNGLLLNINVCSLTLTRVMHNCYCNRLTALFEEIMNEMDL